MTKSNTNSKNKMEISIKATKNTSTLIEVAIIMGSDSDLPHLKGAVEFLKSVDVVYEVKIVSAHRTPLEMVQFADTAKKRGIRVIIAGAGGAAHLPGMVASLTTLPVIGVPVPYGHLQGEDALLSIVQMPKGVPVATVAIGNGYNAGILAAQILAQSPTPEGKILDKKLEVIKEKMRQDVLQKILTF